MKSVWKIEIDELRRKLDDRIGQLIEMRNKLGLSRYIHYKLKEMVLSREKDMVCPMCYNTFNF